MEYVVSAIDSLAPFWWLIPLGVLIGVFIGSVPGFNATNALIILLPFTLGMKPEGALAFMASVYGASEVGGAIPAILFNVPGTGGAAATCLDGYPMGQKGQAQEALVIAFLSSCAGGIVTPIITLLAFPYLRWVVYYFGTIENFILILFGVALIAQITGKNPIKGFIAGFLGLLIGAIGYDHVYSIPRATFGMLQLFDGMPRVPVIVGLFALSEALLMSGRISKDEPLQMNRLESSWAKTWNGVRLTFRHAFTLIHSTLVGFIVGIIPGVGASIASFISYQQTYALAKDKETFGHGNPRGVIASEAANNSVTCGALIPTLTLGIPGSSTASIMLIVLLAHGVPIGPRLFQTDPRLAYSVVLALLFAHLLLLFVGMPLTKLMAKGMNIPVEMLIPAIISFVLIGAFVERRFMFDMSLALFFAVMGYIMKKTGYPVHCLLLGVILGPPAEQYFLRGIQLGKGNIAIFFSKPLGNLLWVLLFISVVGPAVYSRFFSKKNNAATADARGE